MTWKFPVINEAKQTVFDHINKDSRKYGEYHMRNWMWEKY